MSETTNIPWCDSTVNDWEGCTKVSPGCLHCYAEVRDRRMMIERVSHWGPGAPRRKSKSATAMRASLNRKPWVCDTCGWGAPAGRSVTASGEVIDMTPFICCKGNNFHRRRIFSLSQGDWLDPEVPIEWLAEMLESIRLAPDCDHLLCTKWPELFGSELLAATCCFSQDSDAYNFVFGWVTGQCVPSNIWIGTTVEDNNHRSRIDHLLEIPARVRFLSCEPLLEDLDLKYACFNGSDSFGAMPGINWVIVGGESGPKARPCNVEWIRSVRNQCQDANVPVFVKQLGANITGGRWPEQTRDFGNFGRCDWSFIRHPKGGDPAEWPAELRIRQFPPV